MGETGLAGPVADLHVVVGNDLVDELHPAVLVDLEAGRFADVGAQADEVRAGRGNEAAPRVASEEVGDDGADAVVGCVVAFNGTLGLEGL